MAAKSMNKKKRKKYIHCYLNYFQIGSKREIENIKGWSKSFTRWSWRNQEEVATNSKWNQWNIRPNELSRAWTKLNYLVASLKLNSLKWEQC